MRALISFAVLYVHAFIPTNLHQQRYRNEFALLQQPNESINGSISSNSYYQRPIQKRSSPRRPRKPKFYWKDHENIRKELCLFWKELGINTSDDQQLYIPNEYMLNYFNRNDIRAAIYQIGGRESLAHVLDAQVIPGKWIDAVEFDIVKQVLPLMEEKSISTESKTRQPKQYSNITPASTKGFWSKETAIKELYLYLETYRNHNQRPAVFMPQLSELKPSKLFNALSRFKKLPSTIMVIDDIHSATGLIQYKEWTYFESQLSLLTELKCYLELFHNSSEEVFPEQTDISENGYNNLNDLIRIHGGKVLLADKFDMKLSSGISRGYSYGRFSIQFAVQLLVFIRNQYVLLDPPLQCTHISMPTENDLIRAGHKDLADQVKEYGGYESVARRLGLEFFDGVDNVMDKERFQKGKLLWKQRHNDKVSSSVKKKKTDGVAWDEELVVAELLEYVRVNNTKHELPTDTMPKFKCLEEDGRSDLKRAISKFGGKKNIGRKAGLVT